RRQADAAVEPIRVGDIRPELVGWRFEDKAPRPVQSRHRVGHPPASSVRTERNHIRPCDSFLCEFRPETPRPPGRHDPWSPPLTPEASARVADDRRARINDAEGNPAFQELTIIAFEHDDVGWL